MNTNDSAVEENTEKIIARSKERRVVREKQMDDESKAANGKYVMNTDPIKESAEQVDESDNEYRTGFNQEEQGKRKREQRYK